MVSDRDYLDITTAYRDAKNKAEQIEILAQCYAAPTWEIRHILFNAGYYPVDESVMHRIEKYLRTKQATFGTIRNFISFMADYGSRDIKKLIEDWNAHPWDKAFTITLDKKQKGKYITEQENMNNPDTEEAEPEPEPETEEEKTEEITEPFPIDDNTNDYVRLAITTRCKSLDEEIKDLMQTAAQLSAERNALLRYIENL